MTDQLSEARMFCLLSDLDKEEPPPKKKNKKQELSLPQVQMKHESYSIRAISMNVCQLRTHLSNRGWSSVLLPAASVMLTLTLVHALPHKRAVQGKWVNVFIPQSFIQMLILWNASLGLIQKSNFIAQGFHCCSGQQDGPLTHILLSYTDCEQRLWHKSKQTRS